ncbi:hypothetical protein SCHPADRAFT_897606, partial [Schizopora paradoxa]
REGGNARRESGDYSFPSLIPTRIFHLPRAAFDSRRRARHVPLLGSAETTRTPPIAEQQHAQLKFSEHASTLITAGTRWSPSAQGSDVKNFRRQTRIWTPRPPVRSVSHHTGESKLRSGLGGMDLAARA